VIVNKRRIVNGGRLTEVFTFSGSLLYCNVQRLGVRTRIKYTQQHAPTGMLNTSPGAASQAQGDSCSQFNRCLQLIGPIGTMARAVDVHGESHCRAVTTKQAQVIAQAHTFPWLPSSVQQMS
jgi:hypothetical protein